MAADPVIDQGAGTITLNFQESTNWTLNKMRLGYLLNAYGCSPAPQSANLDIYDNFDDGEFVNPFWRFNDALSFDTALGYIGTAAAKYANPVGSKLAKIGALAQNPSRPRFFHCLFYDSAVNSDSEAFTLHAVGNVALLPQYGNFALGTDNVTLLNHYGYRRPSDSNWVDTGHVRTAGWHRVCVRFTEDFLDPDILRTWRLTLDGILRANLSETNGSNSTAIRSFEFQKYVQPGSQIWEFEDFVLCDFTDKIHETATAQIDCQPTMVKEFRSFSVSEDVTGMWKGTTLYECAFSTDGGSSFTSLVTMTNAVLQSYLCDADGQDVLRIKITHTPDTTLDPHQAHVPRTKQLIVNFAGYRYPFEYFV
jgi:hypothetical protein